MSIDYEFPFYSYLHRRATDNTVFYVGKGTGNRSHFLHGRGRKWTAFYNKHGAIAEIVERFATEEEAFNHERFLIASFMAVGAKLANLTLGGDGVSGYKYTPEQAAKHAESQKKTWERPGYREKHQASMRAVFLDPRYRSRQSEMSKARWADPQKRASILARMPKGAELHNARAVTCLETAETFESISLAVKWLRSLGFESAKSGGIWQCCNKFMRSYCQFHWHYADQTPSDADIERMLRGYAKGKFHYKAKRVVCVETGSVFETATEAVKWMDSIGLSITSVAMTDCCQFTQRQAKGYHFYYADSPPTEKQLKWMFEGRPSGVRAYNAVKVQCVETGVIFPTATAATKWIRETKYPAASVSNIANCCKLGKPKTAYGFHWQYP